MFPAKNRHFDAPTMQMSASVLVSLKTELGGWLCAWWRAEDMIAVGDELSKIPDGTLRIFLTIRFTPMYLFLDLCKLDRVM